METRARRGCEALLLFVALLTLLAPGADATWSIVAVDPETREVGIAGASCILGSELLARLVPGHGAVAAQAIPNLAARDEIARRVAAGESPAAALAAVTEGSFDTMLGSSMARIRQYGVAALGFEHDPANFTGSWAVDFAGARIGNGVTVQGNMLRGADVVEQALEAFEEKRSACKPSLADRLMAALEAGSRAGGDARCSEDLTALSAFLMVAKPDDDPDRPSLHLLRQRPGATPRSPWTELTRAMMIATEPGGADENPVTLLRQAYDAQRGSGRCP
jgi:uncharacterized Ntn-hydrolase superfamily protein